MSQRIDEELEKVTKLGEVAKAIHVGSDLYNELYREINPIYAAPIVGPNDKAPAYPAAKEPEIYKGIPVKQINNVPNDYLKIIT